MGTKLDFGAMDVGPAAKRMYSLRAAADSDTAAGAIYDSNGNLTRLDYDDDTSEQWTYDAATGQVASYTDQEGRLIKQRIDPATGRVTAVVRVVGLDDDASEETDDLVTEYAYTDGSGTLPAGLLRSIADPTGAVTRIEYEDDPDSPDFGRAVGLTYAYGTADAATIQFGYDEDGNLATLIDAVGNATTWVLDAESRVTCESIVIDQQTLTREYVYDANGRLWIYTDRNGRAVEYLYNAEELIEFEKWYDTGDDPRDEPTPTPDRTIRYSYTYDPAGRLTGFAVNDTDVDLAYTYDAAGYLTAASWDFADLSGTDNVTFAYIYGRGDLKTVSATVDGTDDFKNEYAYDSFGRLTQVTQTDVSGGNAVADKRVDFSYNSAGQLATIARFADLAGLDPVASTVYTHNADLGWLTGLVHTINDTNETITYGYTYEDDGKIDTLDSSEDGLYDYDYDDQDQLTDVTLDTGGGPTAVEHYEYDDNGNRTCATAGLSSSAYTTGAYNRLESVDDGTTVTVFGYDAEGNTVLKFTDVDESGTLTTGDTQIVEYAWDHRNRLVAVTNYDTYADYDANASQAAQYGYDFLNRLVVRTVDGQGEYFIYDGDSLATDWILGEFGASEGGEAPFGPDPEFDLGQIVLQLNGDGSPTHRYLWGQAVDQILADETVDDGSLEDVLWLLTDHQNSVRDMVKCDAVNNQWTLANHIVYEAFGKVVSETSAATDCLFAWTARLFDAATDLQQNGARWYNQPMARWWSEDRIGFLARDANLYRYCQGSGPNATDPSGLQFEYLSGNAFEYFEWAEAQPIVVSIAFPSDMWSGGRRRCQLGGRRQGYHDQSGGPGLEGGQRRVGRNREVREENQDGYLLWAWVSFLPWQAG